MRLLIDLQATQIVVAADADAADAQLGLIRAILHQGAAYERVVLLNAAIADAIAPLRSALADLLAADAIRVWDPPAATGGWSSSPADPQHRAAALIREACIARLKPDRVLLDGVLVGWDDPAVITVGALGTTPPTCLLLRDRLDTTPDDRAAAASPREVWYADRIDQLRRVDRLLVADAAARTRVLDTLDLSPSVVVDIDLPGAQGLVAAADRVIAAVAAPFGHALPVTPPWRDRRPRLAFVSPLPPVQSGISDYSAELLPELSRYYRIEVVLAQPEAGGAWVRAQGATRSVDWLRANAERLDRVLYQLGNSLYHQHMLSLIEEVPGIVVLHDLFISWILAPLELNGEEAGVWSRELFASHGYGALKERFDGGDVHQIMARYPCNARVLRNARHLIVHSASAKHEIEHWYRDHTPMSISVVPMPRVRPASGDRAAARAALNLPEHAFVVCSFGHIGEAKLSRRLLSVWLSSGLADHEDCVLVFVGQAGGDYGWGLSEAIAESRAKDRILVTGWVDQGVFRDYLAAADAAVQLRARSYGETSAAVLDCLMHGLPTIVNAVGSMAELPRETVVRLTASFSDAELGQALEALRQGPQQRRELGERARRTIQVQHAPAACAERYAEVIEGCYVGPDVVEDRLLAGLVEIDGLDLGDSAGVALARSIGRSVPGPCLPRQWLLDVSATCRSKLRTGIERVARALMLALIECPPAGVRVEPVYLSEEGEGWQLRYARRFTAALLECPTDLLDDDIVEPRAGDVLIHLDLHADRVIAAGEAGLYRRLRTLGVSLYATVFDLLPVMLPHCFPPGADGRHGRWLETVADFDGAVCISAAVAEDYRRWCAARQPSARSERFRIGWFHLGADLARSAPTDGLPADVEEQLALMAARPTFLMVNTIEPRKGYLQTLAAFDVLWAAGIDVGLVIVGREGWIHVSERERRNIPEIVGRLRRHAEMGGRLLWLEHVSDEHLERLYAAAACLINASEGEGFGLPLVEAAWHGLPIIARDIPVFREVVGDGAQYFHGTEPQALADLIRDWLAGPPSDKSGAANPVRVGSWGESAAVLVAMLSDSDHPNWLGDAASRGSA